MSVDFNFSQRRFDGAEEGRSLRRATAAPTVQPLNLADKAHQVVPGQVRWVAVWEGNRSETCDQLGLQLGQVFVDAGLPRLQGADLRLVGIQRGLQVCHLHPQAPNLLLHRFVGRTDLFDFRVQSGKVFFTEQVWKQMRVGESLEWK